MGMAENTMKLPGVSTLLCCFVCLNVCIKTLHQIFFVTNPLETDITTFYMLTFQSTAPFRM